MQEEVDSLLDELLADEETESELGRWRAYRNCLRYAEQHLAASRLCNLFLYAAAERLSQQPMAIPVVHHRVPLSPAARLCLYPDEDPDLLVLVGNRAGLRYLSELCGELAEQPVPGESVELELGYPPWAGESYGLTLYIENEAWFEAVEEDRDGELVDAWEADLQSRIVRPEAVQAMQFAGPIPAGLQLTPHKLYRAAFCAQPPDEELQVISPAAESVKLHWFKLVDDDDLPISLGVSLDDPAVTFYYSWHLEQFLKGEAETMTDLPDSST